MKVQGIVALAVVALSIAACGGGGGGGSSVPAATATSAPSSAALPAGYAVDNVSINMPKGTYAASAARRGVQTVGAGTVSITFTLLQQNGASASSAPQNFGLTASSTGCTPNVTTGALTCVLPVGAPIGTDVFLAQTYDVNGNLTGSGAIAMSVVQNAQNTASIVLSAQVAQVYMFDTGDFLGNQYLDSSARRPGTFALRRTAQKPASRARTLSAIQSVQIYIIALDNQNNTILNPSAYNAPIYLQLAFDNYDGQWMTPDVVLTANYASGDPSPCVPGGSLTAASWYASIPICSPGDTIIASLASSGGTDPSYDAYIYSNLSSSTLVPTPAPSASPMPLPTPTGVADYLDLCVNYPTPAPTGGTIQVNPQ